MIFPRKTSWKILPIMIKWIAAFFKGILGKSCRKGDVMCDLRRVLELLEQKRQLLCRVEEATQGMLACPGQQLEELMGERERLIQQLQKADEELEELCRDQEDGEAVLAAAGSRWEGEMPSGELAEVCLGAQRLRTVLSRLRESETQAMLRLKQEQLEILEKIKTANQGGAAKAARFYSQAGASGTGSRLGKA